MHEGSDLTLGVWSKPSGHSRMASVGARYFLLFPFSSTLLFPPFFLRPRWVFLFAANPIEFKPVFSRTCPPSGPGYPFFFSVFIGLLFLDANFGLNKAIGLLEKLCLVFRAFNAFCRMVSSKDLCELRKSSLEHLPDVPSFFPSASPHCAASQRFSVEHLQI